MTVGSQRNPNRDEYGQQSEIRRNLRDALDVISFYFTRFPEDTNETELWYVFKKWGDVQEVFIARNRNKWGKRYGFVRFKGVKDVTTLERKLDSLVVGGLKMHVNVPKHGRERMVRGEGSSGRNQGKEKPPQHVKKAASFFFFFAQQKSIYNFIYNAVLGVLHTE